MRTPLTKVRLWVIGPVLLYLFVFLLWFPRWQHTPHAYTTRALGLVFGGMTAVLMAIYLVGAFQWRFGWLVDIVVHVYETYLTRNSGRTPDAFSKRIPAFATGNAPALVITKRLKDGTPVRGACPVCEVEFSTEAFDHDRAFPHESTLKKWYGEHFGAHFYDQS